MATAGNAWSEVDQALAFHQVSPHRFEVSGLRTGSVRDQMLRAQLLAEQLVQPGRLLPHKDSLLVIGAGAAGVTLALAASKRGIEVTLMERNPAPFGTQFGVTSRRLHPTEFDWPQPHWNSGGAAWGAGSMPLSFPADRADALAAAWEKTFFDWINQQSASPNPAYGHIHFAWGLDARNFLVEESTNPAQPGVVLTELVRPGVTQHFGAAVSCIGFSGEKVAVPGTGGDYVGYEFWGPDTLDSPTLGTGKSSGDVRVLVSGGGDGAQQDLLRALTGDFGVKLWDRLIPLGLPRLELADAVLAEDYARRAYAWASTGARPEQALSGWNAAYEGLVDQIWRHWGPSQYSVIAQQILRPNVDLTWIVGGDGPDFAYGLNRLLALLIVRLHATVRGRAETTAIDSVTKLRVLGNEVLVKGHYLQSVAHVPGPGATGSAAAHTCGSPRNCLGQSHRAFVTAAKVASSAYPLLPLGPFDVVIIRHGAKQTPYFRRAPVAEQIVPFDLPS